ncbi:MAG: tetratricopeptide repeat protein [Pseudomonadota bacterium]|nr:tetratricopeptide repeat protein [Pseudomonadota bacterium]|tara:strand:- start:1020 stop:1673 length:654 start_codon:yes stop_codon:yes gene_type:complete
MDDIFKEVDEELREERLTKIWKRIGPYVIGILSGTIIITSAVIGYREYDETQRQNWGVQFAEAMNLSEEGNWQESLDLFEALTEKTNLGYKTLSLFQAASLYAKNGNKEKALEIYQSLESKALDENFRDLATLMLIYLQFDNADPEILEKRIEKLASKGNPWYYNAMELKGFLFAKQKNKEKQIEIFNILSKDNKAPEGVRTRANDMLAILGEEPQK